jgi:hypothetical protein
LDKNGVRIVPGTLGSLNAFRRNDMNTRRVGPAFLLLVMVGSTRADEASAIAALEQLKAKIVRDELKPGRPVIRVTLPGVKALNAGLKDLKELKELKEAYFTFCNVTDAGLKDINDLKQLEKLGLWGTKVTDAGLKDLKGLNNLTYLNLSSTKVTDAGLKDLIYFQQLKELDLKRTKVTEAGVKELQKALPGCKILR